MNSRPNLPRIGILGAGSISDYHIQGLQKAGAVIAALFSLDMDLGLQESGSLRYPALH